MLKKYMYVVILLGAVVLAGCNGNMSSEEQIKLNEKISENRNNGQVADAKTLSNTDEEEVLLVSPLELTQEQKNDYYRQYEEITKKVNSEYNQDLYLSPLEEFKSEEWVTPEDFKKIAIDMANAEFTSKAFGGDSVE